MQSSSSRVGCGGKRLSAWHFAKVKSGTSRFIVLSVPCQLTTSDYVLFYIEMRRSAQLRYGVDDNS